MLFLIARSSSGVRKSRDSNFVHFLDIFFFFSSISLILKWQLARSRLSKCRIVEVPILLFLSKIGLFIAWISGFVWIVPIGKSWREKRILFEGRNVVFHKSITVMKNPRDNVLKARLSCISELERSTFGGKKQRIELSHESILYLWFRKLGMSILFIHLSFQKTP